MKIENDCERFDPIAITQWQQLKKIDTNEPKQMKNSPNRRFIQIDTSIRLI